MLFVGRVSLTPGEQTTVRLACSLEQHRTYVVRVHQEANSNAAFGAGTTDRFSVQSINPLSTSGPTTATVASNQIDYVEAVLRPGDDVQLVNNSATASSRVALSVFEK